MATGTIRISDASRDILREIAKQERKPMQTVLDQAIEAYRRQKFLQEVNEGFAALRENEVEWKAEQKERADWDITLNDGLEK